MYNDPELNAMSEVYDVLKSLDLGQVNRILMWAASRLGVEDAMISKDTPVKTEPAAEGDSSASADEPVETEVKADEPPAQESDSAPAPQTEEATSQEQPNAGEQEEEKQKDVLKGLGLKRYKTIENLFLAANVTTVSSRILLAAAYLQEKKGMEELSSYDINSRLKKLGYGVPNITNSINTLLNKNLMKQTRKQGDSKQAKRKFVVTSEGLLLARTYLGPADETE